MNEKLAFSANSTITVVGRVVIAEVRTTSDLPRISHAAMSSVLSACQQTLTQSHLIDGPWCILYDFTDANGFEPTALMAAPSFSRWANSHGRQRSAVIYPKRLKVEEMSRLRKIVISIIRQFSRAEEDDYYVAKDRDDAMTWFCQTTIGPESGEVQERSS